jgi:hypothetical protein
MRSDNPKQMPNDGELPDHLWNFASGEAVCKTILDDTPNRPFGGP